jgi:hypothetical protein
MLQSPSPRDTGQPLTRSEWAWCNRNVSDERDDAPLRFNLRGLA